MELLGLLGMWLVWAVLVVVPLLFCSSNTFIWFVLVRKKLFSLVIAVSGRDKNLAALRFGDELEIKKYKLKIIRFMPELKKS
jgi:hypothetical protein